MKPLGLLILFLIAACLVSAQETCFKACTRDSGINQCTGSTPHDDAAWAALDISVQTCYCDAAILFASCNPGCSTLGFTADAFGRSLGQWRYVDGVCNSTVAAFTATAVISTNSEYNLASTVYSGNITAATATTTIAVNVTSTTVPATLSALTNTPTPTITSTPLPASADSSSSHDNPRTIALSVSLSIVGLIAIGAGIWFLMRRRRRIQLTQNIYETRNAMVIVVGPDGLPMSPDAPDYPPQMLDPNNENVKRWIEEQREREPDLSVGYTLWTDTELAMTEAGDERERERDMETIVEIGEGEVGRGR